MNTGEVEILVVEDERSDAILTIRALKKGNIANHILHLKDGREALDFLFGEGKFEGRDINLKPRVILLDLKMPHVNGIEVLRKIKSEELTKKIPVVVLTTSLENPDVEQCYLLGVNSYIVKPVVIEDFVKVVNDLGLYWVIHNQKAE
jgi:CheY-like chemotaxis protein